MCEFIFLVVKMIGLYRIVLEFKSFLVNFKV